MSLKLQRESYVFICAPVSAWLNLSAFVTIICDDYMKGAGLGWPEVSLHFEAISGITVVFFLVSSSMGGNFFGIFWREWLFSLKYLEKARYTEIPENPRHNKMLQPSQQYTNMENIRKSFSGPTYMPSLFLLTVLRNLNEKHIWAHTLNVSGLKRTLSPCPLFPSSKDRYLYQEFAHKCI